MAKSSEIWVGVVAATALAVGVAGCGGDGASESEKERAIAAAKGAYRAAVAAHLTLEDGACLAERLPGLQDWVVDIAHDPRRPVDDEPQNQCQRYRAGEASHFVELDPSGKLIRAE